MKKRILSMMIAIVMMVVALPTSVVAAVPATSTDGTACAVSGCSGYYVNGFCSVCDGYEAATLNEDGYYEIGNAGQLYWFADLVNKGNPAVNAILTADIMVNEGVLAEMAKEEPSTSGFRVWNPIGVFVSLSTCFGGKFDGNGHIVSGLYFNNTTQDYIGLFGMTLSCVIQNVGVVDSYFCGSDYIGGIVGFNSGTVENCYNMGAVSGESNVGGVAGTSSKTISNCYFNSDVFSGKAVESAGGTVVNVAGKTAEQFASGEVAYLLGEVFGQNLSKNGDPYPVSATENNKIYEYINCNGKLAYTNDQTLEGTTADNNYSNGFCVSGCYQPAVLNENGYYEIGNAGQLYWFADKVNNDDSSFGHANAILTADITVNEGVLAEMAKEAPDTLGFREWTPIGEYNIRFNGEFDGNGHTVSGLYFNNTTQSYIGLVGCIGKDGTVHDVGMVDSYFGGKSCVGGVIGCNYGTVENCYGMGTVYGVAVNIGGVVGYNDGAVENCYFNSDGLNFNAVGGGQGTSVNVIGKTAEQFTNGEVAYLLGSAFGQKIGEDGDSYPVFATESNKIYAYLSCNGTSNIYTNDQALEGTITDHSFGINGFCIICDDYQPATLNADGYYEIGNAGQLYWFADEVNNGNKYINAILTSDIKVNEGVLVNGALASDTSDFRGWIPIGCSNFDFSGIFDGNGHTISGLYLNNAPINSPFGLIGTVRDGTIQNVGVIDSYISGSVNMIGGVVGLNKGTVKNCFNTGIVVGDNEMLSVNVGGVVGINDGAVVNCYNIGNIIAFDPYSCNFGGLVGDTSGRGSVTNCYYLDSCGASGAGQAATAEEFANGNVAYLLGEAFGQKIGKDTYPVLGGDKIYVGYFSCADEKIGYTNDSGVSSTPIDHSFDENGFCSACDAYQPATLNEEDYYEIGNAGQLMWFAAKVNAGEYGLNAVLTHNVDMNAIKWAAMGRSSDTPYTGTFDGAGYTISNLSRNAWSNEGDRASFVYYLGQDGCIKNVTFDLADVFTQGHANANASAVVALRNAGTIEGVIVSNSKVQLGNYAYLAGIVGVNENGGIIRNCAVLNTALTRRFGHNKPSGAIVYNNQGTVENCYAYGCSYGTANESNGGILVGGNEPVNSYYYTTSTVAEKDYAQTAEQFESGEVAYALGEAWGQRLGVDGDKLPVLRTAENEIFRYAECNGTITYSNSKKPQVHDMSVGSDRYSNGFCLVCGACQNAHLNENGYYEISNAGQLYWFAEKVNAGETTLNAELTADIVINENVLTAEGMLNGDGSNFRAWTPISTIDFMAQVYGFAGIFNGNGYSVSSLFLSDVEEIRVGFFGAIAETGVVKNLTIKDSYFYVEKANSVGAVVGFSYGVIENCHSYATLDLKECNEAGGIAGAIYLKNSSSSAKISDCTNRGRIISNSVNTVGGVVGDLFLGVVMERCVNYGKITFSYETGITTVGGVVGHNSGAAMRYCANVGEFDGEHKIPIGTTCSIVGGVVGSCGNDGTYYDMPRPNAELISCYNFAKLPEIEKWESIGAFSMGHIVGMLEDCVWEYEDENGELVNEYVSFVVSSCYFIDDGYYACGNAEITEIGVVPEYYLEGSESKTEEQFRSGEVAYLLGGAWGQTIGEDEYPTIGGKKVYMDNEGNYCDVILGDVSGDGLVTNADVLAIYRYIYNAELYPLDVTAGDVNKDGAVTNADVLAIYRYIYNPELYPIG